MLSSLQNVSLQPYNTFGIKAFAKYFFTLQTVEEAQELFRSDFFKSQKHLFIGGGSNLLLTQDFDGVVVKVDIKGIEIVKETDETIQVKVGAGENWHDFVMYCVQHNWGGAENLSLIPGTMGAAPMQNIGAYGVEVKNIIDSVTAVDINSGNVKIFTNEGCKFGYRESVFKQNLKGKYFISSVTLTLTKKNHLFTISYGAIETTLEQNNVHELSVRAISDAVIHIRRSKLPDPAVIGNAGSFFKNPSIQANLHDLLKTEYPSMPSYPGENGLVKVSAAWLIEQCGWKGKKIDNIGVHDKQALVLVNFGGGSGEKIWQLAMNIQESVQEKFTITLQPEVNVI